MRIALIDPFFDMSHRLWAEGLRNHSSHEIDIYHGSPNFWKWKMTGGTLEMASQLNHSKKGYDLIIGTDMLNIPLFTSLLNDDYKKIPVFAYFHENQITYPWSATDKDVIEKRDHHYGFINFCSALVADKVFFNSNYHYQSFIEGLPVFLKKFPEGSFYKNIENIKLKSGVLTLGMELPAFSSSKSDEPTFIWNHRWEYDKNPETFFQTMFALKEKGISFKLIVTGYKYDRSPAIFQKAKSTLKKEIIHFGFANSRVEYNQLLALSNILLVTSYQDFFGMSSVEAIASGCYPIFPDRLSYREHIDDETDIIYKNDEDLLEHVMKIIVERKYLDTEKISRYVRKYEWQNLIESYDEQFTLALR